MPDNEHVIVGASRVVCVVTLPSELPAAEDDAQFVATLPLLGVQGDSIITMVTPSSVARLRKLGAEVAVVDTDPNAYAQRIEDAGDAEALVASIDADLSKAKADLAIAQAGRDDADNGKA